MLKVAVAKRPPMAAALPANVNPATLAEVLRALHETKDSSLWLLELSQIAARLPDPLRAQVLAGVLAAVDGVEVGDLLRQVERLIGGRC